MKKIRYRILLFIMLFSSLLAKAQYDPDKVCRIENGKIIFTLNLKWTEKEKNEICGLFDLDSALIARVYLGETNISYEGESWTVKKVKPNSVELSKPFLTAENKKINRSDELFFLIDKWMNFSGNTAEPFVVYGTNNFAFSNALH